MVSWIAETTPSSAACQGPGDGFIRRLVTQETKNRNTITLHVVITVSLIRTFLYSRTK